MIRRLSEEQTDAVLCLINKYRNARWCSAECQADADRVVETAERWAARGETLIASLYRNDARNLEEASISWENSRQCAIQGLVRFGLSSDRAIDEFYDTATN